MTQKFSNNARSRLVGALSNSATTFTIEAPTADLFPVANTTDWLTKLDWFKATLERTTGEVEIVHVGVRSSGSAIFSNVLRGRDGTTALSFSAGETVGLRITSADLEGAINVTEVNNVFTGSNEFTQPVTADVTGDLTGNAATVTNGVYTTGDQTIAGVKTFSSAPTVPDGSFTFPKLQNIATARVLGRSTAGAGDVEELTLGANLTLSGGVLSAADGVPAGAVTAFARNTAPAGWLNANGAAVSRVTYLTLFNAIGITFGGGDGSTTFNLPDLRGEFVRGWDNGRGADSGRVFGSAQGDAFRSHNHAMNFYSLTGANVGALGGAGSSSNYRNMSNEGGAETRPRNVALLYCIKF